MLIYTMWGSSFCPWLMLGFAHFLNQGKTNPTHLKKIRFSFTLPWLRQENISMKDYNKKRSVTFTCYICIATLHFPVSLYSSPDWLVEKEKGKEAMIYDLTKVGRQTLHVLFLVIAVVMASSQQVDTILKGITSYQPLPNYLLPPSCSYPFVFCP